jgi:heptosyltransferase-2
MPDNVRRLVVFVPNWLGDAVMALPAIADVRRAQPKVHLAVAARRSVAPLFDAVPIVDEVIALDSRGGILDRSRFMADVQRLRAGRFDAALLLPNSFAAAYLAWRAGVPERWGYRGDFRRLLLTRAAARPSPRGHQAEYYQELVRELTGSGLRASGLGPDAEPLVSVAPAAADRARGLLAARGWRPEAPLVGIAPGAAYGHAKRWPPAHFAAAMRALAADGLQLVVVGSAGDVDSVREIGRALSQEASRIAWIDLAGRTDLSTLIGVLGNCRALVTNDSGAMHLAAAIGVPVTAMFGPTDERATSPLPRGGDTAHAHAVLATDVRCRPCMLRDCPIDHRCMTRILPEDVVAQVRRQLA